MDRSRSAARLPSTALWSPRCHLRRSVRTRVSFSTRPASAPCARAPRLLASPHRLSEPRAPSSPCPRPPPPLPACSATSSGVPPRCSIPTSSRSTCLGLGSSPPPRRSDRSQTKPLQPAPGRRRLRFGASHRPPPPSPPLPPTMPSPPPIPPPPPPTPYPSTFAECNRCSCAGSAAARRARRACISSSTAPPPARRPIRCSSPTPRASSRALSRCCRGCANGPRPARRRTIRRRRRTRWPRGPWARIAAGAGTAFAEGEEEGAPEPEEEGEGEVAPSPASEIAAMVFAPQSPTWRSLERSPTPASTRPKTRLVGTDGASCSRSPTCCSPTQRRSTIRSHASSTRCARRCETPSRTSLRGWATPRSPHFSAGSDRRQRAGRSCCSSCARSSTRCSNSRRAAAVAAGRPPPTEAEA